MSKVWFITGTGSGIGASAAKVALEIGDRVVTTGGNVQKLRNALCDVVIAGLLAGSCAAYATQETPIQVAMEDGKTTAQFTVGDSRCLLVEDEIRCTRAAK
jgi:NAD(P)-dependent dehydrogenase (short-subunit alcohol dehydrogenase family)